MISARLSGVLPRVFRIAAALAPLGAPLSKGRAETDPYAINPFHVTQRTAPADPAVRWAGFTNRVGTYLPTDAYHWWRFDIHNRAEVQDAFWNVQAPGDVIMPDWNGSAPITPGDVKQSWRDALMRTLNLQRYYYLGTDATYLEEDSDATRRLELQATALIEGEVALIKGRGYTHGLRDTDMPSGFAYATEAKFWAVQTSLGACHYASDITAFLHDAGNNWPGHRLYALNPGTNRYALGWAGPNPTNSPVTTPPYPTLVYYSTDTVAQFQSGPNFGSTDVSSCPAPPQYDPFDKPRVYPYTGYVTVDDVWQGGRMPLSVEFSSAGLLLDISEAQITVTRDGVNVPVSNVDTSLEVSWRQSFYFTAELGFFPYAGPAYPDYKDGTVTVTISGLKFKTNSAFTPTGRADDEAPYLAASDPRCFQPHTISWSFTVFDPATVQSAPFPAVRSDITNLSTRAAIGSGDNSLQAGFVIEGTEPLRLAIRAQGPTLANYGIQHPAIDPQVEIFELGNPNVDLGGNDNWKSGPNWRLVQSYGLNPDDSREAVAVAILKPGRYSAVVTDPSNPNLGVGIVEVFALDAQSQSRLKNVSTRATLGTGENVLTAGFILQRDTTVVVRTQSPSLAKYGVPNVVSGTKLSIVRNSDQVVLATNAGWNAPGSVGNDRFGTDLAGYIPGDPREAAQIITLPAGLYSALVESADGTPGVGIVEVFNVN